MVRMHTKREWIEKYSGICPRIQEKLNKIKLKSLDFECHNAAQGLWEVSSGLKSWVVDFKKKSCSCREWDLTGIPCAHSTCAILQEQKIPEDFVSPYYSVDMYKRAYNHIIHPVPDHSQWDPPSAQEQELPLMPPPFKKRTGRTKKIRRKGVDEVNVSGKVTRQGTLINCSNCGSNTHNKRRCNMPPQSRPQQSRTSKNALANQPLRQKKIPANQSRGQPNIPANQSRGQPNVAESQSKGASQNVGTSTNGGNSQQTWPTQASHTTASTSKGKRNNRVKNANSNVPTPTSTPVTAPAPPTTAPAPTQAPTHAANTQKNKRKEGRSTSVQLGFGNWNGVGMFNQFRPLIQIGVNNKSQIQINNNTDGGKIEMHVHSTRYGNVRFFSQPSRSNRYSMITYIDGES